MKESREREEEIKREIYAPHFKVIVTWLCVVRNSPMIKRCINHDITRKIAEMIPIDLSSPVGEWVLFSTVHLGFKWREKENVYLSGEDCNWGLCHICCMPCLNFAYKKNDKNRFSAGSVCSKHHEEYKYEDCECQGHGLYFSFACAKKFRHTHIFP